MSFAAAVRQRAVTAIIALCAGFVGSGAYEWGKAGRAIRATRFEVTDASGRILSYWGPDTAQPGTHLVFADRNGVPRCQIGFKYSPELQFYDSREPLEGKRPRFRVTLAYNDDPALTMADADGQRVFLGATHDDAPTPSEDQWALSLTSRERARAGIGFYRWWDGSYRSSVELRDGAGKTWEAFTGELKPLPLVQRQTTK